MGVPLPVTPVRTPGLWAPGSGSRQAGFPLTQLPGGGAAGDHSGARHGDGQKLPLVRNGCWRQQSCPGEAGFILGNVQTTASVVRACSRLQLSPAALPDTQQGCGRAVPAAALPRLVPPAARCCLRQTCSSVLCFKSRRRLEILVLLPVRTWQETLPWKMF